MKDETIKSVRMTECLRDKIKSLAERDVADFDIEFALQGAILQPKVVRERHIKEYFEGNGLVIPDDQALMLKVIQEGVDGQNKYEFAEDVIAARMREFRKQHLEEGFEEPLPVGEARYEAITVLAMETLLEAYNKNRISMTNITRGAAPVIRKIKNIIEELEHHIDNIKMELEDTQDPDASITREEADIMWADLEESIDLVRASMRTH